MELLLAAVLGLMTGLGVASVHPAVDAGRLIAAATGALGGWIAAAVWGDVLAASFAGHSFAGAAVAGALGGAVLALAAGVGLTLWRRSRQ